MWIPYDKMFADPNFQKALIDYLKKNMSIDIVVNKDENFEFSWTKVVLVVKVSMQDDIISESTTTFYIDKVGE